jgi:hypothetical protein
VIIVATCDSAMEISSATWTDISADSQLMSCVTSRILFDIKLNRTEKCVCSWFALMFTTFDSLLSWYQILKHLGL